MILKYLFQNKYSERTMIHWPSLKWLRKKALCVCVHVCACNLERGDGEREKELTKANEQSGILDKVSSFL